MEELIDKIVKEYPDFAKKWIEVRLKNEINTNKKLPDENTIRNIRDCLSSLDKNSKTIKKLDKISFKDMNIIQDKWHKELARKSEKLKEFGGNPFEYEPVLKCDNGFQWVRLDTAEAKDFEGNAMGHCVGQGGYDDNKTTIFSLRGKDNIPHITVEFDKEKNEIVQIQGKGNTEPNKKYYDDIIKLYEKTGATNYDKLIGNKTSAILNSKVLIGDEAILSCPPDTVFDSVKLGYDSNIKEWNCDVQGDFNAGGSKLEYVNPKCNFGGKIDMNLTYAVLNDKILLGDEAILAYPPDTVFDYVKLGDNSKITEWNYSVKGCFYAGNSKLEYVSPDCKFGSYVDIRNTNIKEWNCSVKGDFNAGGSELEYVNPKYNFGGKIVMYEPFAILNDKILLGDEAILACQDDTVFNYVNLGFDSKITEWNYSVKGDFIADHSKLEYVSPNCVFGGCVNIKETNIKEWNCDVHGDFYAQFSALKSVSPDCKFGGYVNIGNIRIKEWHCDVKGDFYAGGSELEYVSPKCNFGGKVDIRSTNIKEWNCDVGCDFTGNTKLEFVNPECKFGGDVNLFDTNIVGWNGDYVFGGEVDIKETNIKEWNCDVEIINEEKQTMRM